MNIEKQRAEIFKDIYGVNRFSDILEQFEADYNKCKNKGIAKVQDLYKRYSYAIFFMYSPSSIRNNLVKFKNVIKSCGGKYEKNALDAFTIDEIYAPIKKKDEERKKELKTALRDGEATNIDPNHVVNQINALKEELDTKSYTMSRNQKEPQVRGYRILAMLGLAMGRRFTENLMTLEVKKRGTKITFSGLLKGNLDTIEGHIIGLTYKEVKSFLKELREAFPTDGMTEQEVNAKYAKVFNNALKRLGFTNVKSLRHNYAVAGSQLFKEGNETTEDTITRILGHKEAFSSALNYT